MSKAIKENKQKVTIKRLFIMIRTKRTYPLLTEAVFLMAEKLASLLRL